MNFSSAEKVAQVIENLKDAELRRAPNRALVNALFNGAPPYTQAEAEENKVQWNVNWGEGADLLLQGREQLENAHLSTDFAFTVRLPDAPKSQQSRYGQKITKLTNRLLRKSRPYFHTQRSKWGSVILHGTGAQMWQDEWTWRPHFIGIDDLLIPTDTELPLENLNHFAVRRRMSPGQLFRKTFGRPEHMRDPAWNLKTVQKVLSQYKDVNQNQNSWNWAEQPEKMAELWKQNAMYYETDAVPTIWMWDFFFQEDDNPKPCWYRKILLDNDCVPGRGAQGVDDPVVYLYDSKKKYADTLDQVLHIQFIDGNNVPPFMYHSCRGLGLRLHDSVQAMNRLRCQFMQKVFEDMMLLFRAADPVDRSRLDKIYLGMNYGIIPDGLNFVTREQRYTPDARLVEMQMQSLKQLIGEGSQQYTQDIDTGTNKERTATEVSALLNQTTRLTGSMLNLSYMQETFAYEEICRRLTLRNSPDWEVRRFQNDCIEAGIPLKWLDAARWEIEPVRVLGSGSTQLEQAQAQALLQVRPMLNPQAQQEVMHDYVFAITHDPKRANRLAPLDGQPQVSDTQHDTELAFGAIMSGSLVTPKPGVVPVEAAGTTIRLMAMTVQRIMQTDGVGTPQDVMGLQNAAKYASAFIQQLAQDKTAKETVKKLGDALQEIMNLVKAMAQRQEEARKQQGMDPELMQKLQAQQAADQQKLATNEKLAQQKLAANEATTAQKLKADLAEAQLRIQTMQAELAAKLRQQEIELQAEARMRQAEAHMAEREFEHDEDLKERETDAQIENDDRLAEAEAKRAESEARRGESDED